MVTCVTDSVTQTDILLEGLPDSTCFLHTCSSRDLSLWGVGGGGGGYKREMCGSETCCPHPLPWRQGKTFCGNFSGNFFSGHSL